jgi:hypothetical protein
MNWNNDATKRHDEPAHQLENGRCRDCGTPLGAGYLCDDCDGPEIHD